MATELQRAVPECRDPSCPCQRSLTPGLGVLLGLGVFWGSPLAGQRLPHPLDLRLQG